MPVDLRVSPEWWHVTGGWEGTAGFPLTPPRPVTLTPPQAVPALPAALSPPVLSDYSFAFVQEGYFQQTGFWVGSFLQHFTDIGPRLPAPGASRENATAFPMSP